MAADPNYWKRRYQQLWAASASKEQTITKLLEEATGRSIQIVGFGAGSKDFLDGTAQEHGRALGDADLHIVGTNIFIEVTGPISERVDRDADLWIRPDKIEAARAQSKTRKTVVLHHLARTGEIRVISLNHQFFFRYDGNMYRQVHPTIRGTRETYVAIPADDVTVRPLESLIRHVKTLPP
jgi:hypothetical protein